MTYTIRKSTLNDIESLVKILNDGKEFLKQNNINQWQFSEPNEESLRKDIAKNNSYVLLLDEKIIGTAALTTDIEASYENIIEGNWFDEILPYYAIHRIAIDNNYRGKGLSKIFMKLLIDYIANNSGRDIRIDTHEENIIMQKLILGCGFKYTGIIFIEGIG